ncbi:MAG: DegT/DnrJ/EryC1/StrS family aminotransferase [Victivallaceae bacterium]|nr:DegT/DnrJ/EryC1/StrS family aminotransferase [Victivallaceae bacterium]
MKTGKIKEFPAWPTYGHAECNALQEVLNSGQWGIGGTEVEKFEKTFAAYQGCRYSVAMTNGSVTLRNALIACGLEAGAEVIVPPYTFLTTATSVIEANGVPVFVDIDPDTYCLDSKKIEEAITPNTHAIIPVHLGGHPAAMDEIMEIARKHNLYVIEDSAHAHGAEYKGRRVGSLGDIGSFSFQSSKNLCCGEGGAIVTNNRQLAENCWSIHNCGRVINGAWYQHEHIGGNYRLSQFQAAILNEQIKKLDAETEKRQQNALYLDEKLSQIPGINPLVRQKTVTRHSYHLYIFRYDREHFNGVSRKTFLKALNTERVPASAGYAGLIYKQPLMLKKQFGPFSGWKLTNPGLDYSKTVCPVAEKAAEEEGCWFPHYVLLGSKEDMDDIVKIISKVYEQKEKLTEAEL